MSVRAFTCTWARVRASARECVRLSAVACVCVGVCRFESGRTCTHNN